MAFLKLQEAQLKINADKLSFCAETTEYLGYTLSKQGIKPQPSKVQAILAFKAPTIVNKLRRFLGMVQYYRGMWTKQSKMLAPLTDLVGDCGQTKVPKQKGLRRFPGIGIKNIKKLLT